MISTFTAFFDADVFYGVHLCSLIMELAQRGLFRARWSEDVQKEWMNALHRANPDVPFDKIEKRRRDMDASVPDCLVKGYEGLIAGLNLPDENDRHVLAAAIQGKASVIVTFNLSDFPNERLAPHGMHAKHPDDFLLDLSDIAPAAFLDAVLADLGHYKKPPMPLAEYVERLRKARLPLTAAYISELEILFG